MGDELYRIETLAHNVGCSNRPYRGMATFVLRAGGGVTLEVEGDVNGLDLTESMKLARRHIEGRYETRRDVREALMDAANYTGARQFKEDDDGA